MGTRQDSVDKECSDHGEQNLVDSGGGSQQLPVFETLQPGVFDGVDFMSRQVAGYDFNAASNFS